MPGATTKDGKPSGSYGYDVGGETEKIHHDTNGKGATESDEMPPSGQLGRQDALNSNRFYTRTGHESEPPSVMGKTGYESKAFDKEGNKKSGRTGDVNFVQPDGSWAPAEGRGKV